MAQSLFRINISSKLFVSFHIFISILLIEMKERGINIFVARGKIPPLTEETLDKNKRNN